MSATVQQLEDLLARVQRNRKRSRAPHGEAAPPARVAQPAAVRPSAEAKATPQSEREKKKSPTVTPLERAMESVERPLPPDTEPPGAAAQAAPARAPAGSSPASRVAPERMKPAAVGTTAGSIARTVSTVDIPAPSTFGELVGRSLALRTR